jgi:hypothetical protein
LGRVVSSDHPSGIPNLENHSTWTPIQHNFYREALSSSQRLLSLLKS